MTFLNQDNDFVGFSFVRGLLNPNHDLELKRIAISQTGKGHGKEALNQIIKLCFEELKANRLWLDVFTYNPRALHVYESLGFVVKGTKRKCVLVNGYAKVLY